MAISQSFAEVDRSGRLLRGHDENRIQYMASTTKMVVYDYLLTLIDQDKLPKEFLEYPINKQNAARMMRGHANVGVYNKAAEDLVEAAIAEIDRKNPRLGYNKDSFFKDLNLAVDGWLADAGRATNSTFIANATGLDNRGTGGYFYNDGLNQSTALEMALLTRHFMTKRTPLTAQYTDTAVLGNSGHFSGAFLQGRQGIKFVKTGTGTEDDAGPTVGTSGRHHRVVATGDTFIAALAFKHGGRTGRLIHRAPTSLENSEAVVDYAVLALAKDPRAAQTLVQGVVLARVRSRASVNVARGKELFEALKAEGITPEQAVETLFISALESGNFTDERGTAAFGLLQFQKSIYERARAENPSLAPWSTTAGAPFFLASNQAKAFKTVLTLKEQDASRLPTTTDLYRTEYNIIVNQAANVVQTYVLWNQGHAGGPKILDDVRSGGGTGNHMVQQGSNQSVTGLNNAHAVYKVSDKMLRVHAHAVRAVLEGAGPEYQAALAKVTGEIEAIRVAQEAKPHVQQAIAQETVSRRGGAIASSGGMDWKNPLVIAAVSVAGLLGLSSLFSSSDNKSGGSSWFTPIVLALAAGAGYVYLNSGGAKRTQRADTDAGDGRKDHADAAGYVVGPKADIAAVVRVNTAAFGDMRQGITGGQTPDRITLNAPVGKIDEERRALS